MNIVSSVSEWQSLRKSLTEKSIGFVPTLGHLHAGHVSLCARAKSENEVTVLSIFVNPTQFNNVEDLAKYPRTLENDVALLEDAGIDYLFLPETKEIYQDQYEVMVKETILSQTLEGEFRPGHFDGMLTVVLKLFHLVQPTRAYFGEKDYQQLLLVKKMVDALFLSVDIIGCPTIRDSQGLALSSRNSRLNSDELQKAIFFAKCLQSDKSNAEIKQMLLENGFRVDYVETAWGRRLAAVWVGDVRLIDNVSI